MILQIKDARLGKTHTTGFIWRGFWWFLHLLKTLKFSPLLWREHLSSKGNVRELLCRVKPEPFQAAGTGWLYPGILLILSITIPASAKIKASWHFYSLRKRSSNMLNRKNRLSCSSAPTQLKSELFSDQLSAEAS